MSIDRCQPSTRFLSYASASVEKLPQTVWASILLGDVAVMPKLVDAGCEIWAMDIPSPTEGGLVWLVGDTRDGVAMTEEWILRRFRGTKAQPCYSGGVVAARPGQCSEAVPIDRSRLGLASNPVSTA